MKLQRQYHKALDTHALARSLHAAHIIIAGAYLHLCEHTLNICKSNQRQRVYIIPRAAWVYVFVLIGLENNKFSCWLAAEIRIRDVGGYK
jgi:hypothetical protein